MSTTCRTMQERIVDYLLGTLDATDTQDLQGHLARCDACRQYLNRLETQDKGLVTLGQCVKADMEARQEKVVQAFTNAACIGSRSSRPAFMWIRLARMAVAAVIVLAAGIAIGRLTGPKPVDVETLRADVQASVTASLIPAVQEHLLAVMDQRLESTLSKNETEFSAEIIEQVRQELQVFGAQLTSNSRQVMDQQFTEFVQLLEAARQKDRQRVARAFEQVEFNRLRDAQRIGRGLYTLATQTTELPASTEN